MKGFVYFISADDPNEAVKVGWTARPITERLADLQCGNARTLRVLGKIHAPRALESACHRLLKDSWIRGEWFERGPALDLLIDLGAVGPFEFDDEVEAFELHRRDAEVTGCPSCGSTGLASGPWRDSERPPCPICLPTKEGPWTHPPSLD